jgi:hypothetical protein
LIRDSGWVKNQDPDPGSEPGMNNPDHRISESLETIFGVKILKFFDADPGWKKLEFGNRDKHSGSATLKLGTDITRPVCQKVTVLVISVKCPIKTWWKFF